MDIGPRTDVFSLLGQSTRTSQDMDIFSQVKRSAIMSRVRSKNSQPELIVRKLVSTMGYTYRGNAKDLPGSPDIVFRRQRKAIFVHGCFWHQHTNCSRSRMPKTRSHFWRSKLDGNRKRDRRTRSALKRMGWRTLTIWGCKLNDRDRLRSLIHGFLKA